jgi:hypothetical protein
MHGLKGRAGCSRENEPGNATKLDLCLIVAFIAIIGTVAMAATPATVADIAHGGLSWCRAVSRM